MNVPLVQTTKVVRIPIVNVQGDSQNQGDIEIVSPYKGGKIKLDKIKNKSTFESPQKRIVEVEQL